MKGWRLLSAHCCLSVRGTGTVSGGLAGGPSLALQPLAFIFTAKKPVGTGTVALCTQPDVISILDHKTNL